MSSDGRHSFTMFPRGGQELASINKVLGAPKQVYMLFQNDVPIDWVCHGSNLKMQASSRTHNIFPANEPSCTTETASFNDVLLVVKGTCRTLHMKVRSDLTSTHIPIPLESLSKPGDDTLGYSKLLGPLSTMQHGALPFHPYFEGKNPEGFHLPLTSRKDSPDNKIYIYKHPFLLRAHDTASLTTLRSGGFVEKHLPSLPPLPTAEQKLRRSSRHSNGKSRHDWYRDCSVPVLSLDHMLSYFGVLNLHSRFCVSTMKDPLSYNLYCKRAKKVMDGSLPPGAMLSVQPMCKSAIAISGPVCQMHISELSVRVHLTILSTGEMKLHSEDDSKNRLCACTVI
ncbi:hypothetical protein TNCV_2173161 [Trichonephila clavipes]|nr:hypothetical protein TNCV_2173161 [Trichonephila clavipes]